MEEKLHEILYNFFRQNYELLKDKKEPPWGDVLKKSFDIQKETVDEIIKLFETESEENEHSN
jgi:hypothetical protein